MLLDFFKRYLAINGLSSKTVGHYVTGLNTINALLHKYNFEINSVFDAISIDDLKKIQTFLNENNEFQIKNNIGHNMYSVSFGHFLKFVCGDMSFFKNNIDKMDIVTAKPEIVTTTHKAYKRNQIIIDQSIEGAHYLCEHNNDHQTFISKSTGHSYMEGHHLIPMKYQDQFADSIDVYANIVCLCPICHRLIHYGTDNARKFLAETLYEKRSNRLVKSGIDLSKADFLKLVI